jgi:hypothetical protein
MNLQVQRPGVAGSGGIDHDPVIASAVAGLGPVDLHAIKRDIRSQEQLNRGGVMIFKGNAVDASQMRARRIQSHNKIVNGLEGVALAVPNEGSHKKAHTEKSPRPGGQARQQSQAVHGFILIKRSGH